MHERDIYIRELLLKGALRPKPGSLWGEKLFENKQLELQGIGTVTGTVTDSGLVIVGAKSTQDEAVRSKVVLVRAVGEPPPRWHTRWFDNERTWPTDWDEQGVDVGTVVMVRAVAGVEQGVDDKYIEIRYDEIVAIGQPLDTDGPDMLPAPGWLLLDVDPGQEDTIGKVWVGDSRDALENNQIQWGIVKALPVGYDGTLRLGNRVGFPRFVWTEYVQVGEMRYMPQDEVLVVSDE